MKAIHTILLICFFLFGLSPAQADDSNATEGNLEIEVKAANGKVEIILRAGTQLNAASLVIEHSTDGLNFTTLGSPESTDTEQAFVAYTFTHSEPTKGINYYRVKLDNDDGSLSFTEVAAAYMAVQTE